ncbi:MAG TPA: DUF4412 domain-containing protein [Thermoanaerobaculia bacterium]|nr:DUF4412 domain-containing protein [Thermoanaerobaculia bacterium]
MKLNIAMAIVMLASGSALRAGDMTITSKTSGTATAVSTTYITSTATRTNSPGLGFDVLTDFQKGITYTINHKAKTIKYTKLADLPAFTAFIAEHTPKSKGMDEMNARMNDLYGDPSIFKVESSGTETVMGRSCKKTKITSGSLVWEYSMDTSLRSPIDAATMLKLTQAGYAGMASHPKMAKIMKNLTEAAAKLNGVALKTRMSGYNGEIDNEVTALSQSPIPASTFVLPAGYTMTDQIAESEKAMMAHRH